MKLIMFVAAVVVSCQASTFLNAPSGNGCILPTWKCDCKVVYRCDGTSGFPTDFSDALPADAGCVKDLAPETFQLGIPGKRWRRNMESQEDFCKRECNDRLNAFLCLDEGDVTSYSHAALCLKLLKTADEPFNQAGAIEPCCEIYLQWGLDWCPAKWSRRITTVRCLALAIDAGFNTATSTEDSSYVFTAATGCAAEDINVFPYCTAPPICGN